MSLHERTVRCPICGAPYKVYSMTVADQSACPACVGEAERRMNAPTDEERYRQAQRRANHWR